MEAGAEPVQWDNCCVRLGEEKCITDWAVLGDCGYGGQIRTTNSHSAASLRAEPGAEPSCEDELASLLTSLFPSDIMPESYAPIEPKAPSRPWYSDVTERCILGQLQCEQSPKGILEGDKGMILTNELSFKAVVPPAPIA